MKKMTLTTAALTAVMALSTTTSAFAEVAGSQTTNGTVKVTAGDDPTNPGNLKLTTAPSFDFGETAVGTTKTVETVTDNLGTTDLRATGAGWNVTVQYGDGNGAALTDDTQAWKNDTILGKGFVLKLGTPAYDAASGTGLAPEGAAVTVNTTAQPVAVAAGDPTGANAEGMGTWYGDYAADKSSTSLQIPANNINGSYTAQLLWTLNDTPTV